jgi:hypothetical protein
MPPKIDYNKLIDELLNDEKFDAVIPEAYGTILKQFLSIPGMSDIFDATMRNASSVNEDKMSIKKFYKKVRKLLIEMGEFYGWEDNIIVPNENIWNEDNPQTCLPHVVKVFSNVKNTNAKGSDEYFKVYDICNKIGKNLQNITVDDFQYLNNLHKKFKDKK